MPKIENQAAYDEIMSTTLTQQQISACSNLITSLPYSSLYLLGLAHQLQGEFDDPEGAQMVLDFIRVFAVHEANIL
jgi:hypothetical protein